MNIKKYYFYHCHAFGREDIKRVLKEEE